MKHLASIVDATRLFAALVLITAAASAQPAERDRPASAHPLANQPIEPAPSLPPGHVDLPRYPAISPDGQTLTFSWRGDLWRAPAVGGQAQRLTAHTALDDKSAWSPDGKQIAFNATRDGFRNLYTMNADGTALKQITHEDRFLHLTGWTKDNTLTLASYREADVHKSPRPYHVPAQGGPITRLHDAFGSSPVVSPDGRFIAFVRGRAAWDSPFATNADNRDLWLYDNQTSTFRRLTTNPGNDGQPRWLNNTTLVYLSARPPARINLYRMGIDQDEQDAVALTAFDEDVQHFDLAPQSQTAVMHVWDRLYTLDLSVPNQEPIALDLTAPADTTDKVIVQPLADQADDAALSPDGKVMAMTARGELFVRTVESKNPAQRITRSVARDQNPTWSPDGRYLYFSSDQDGTRSIYRAAVTLTRSEIEASLGLNENQEDQASEEKPADQGDRPTAEGKEDESKQQPDPTPAQSDEDQSADGKDQQDEQNQDKDEPHAADRWHDAIRFEVEPVVQTPHHDSDPSISPDGKTLAYRRGNGQLRLRDLATGDERVYLDSWDAQMNWAWSADSRYLAVSHQDQDHNADIWLGPIDASTPPVNLTKHPAYDYAPSFSSDGKIMTFLSNRIDGQFDVYAVYLDPSLETMTPQQLEDYYKEQASAAKKRKPIAAEVDPSAKVESEQQAADQPETSIDTAELDDAYLRLRRLTRTDESESRAMLLPGGERVVFARSGATFSLGWDGTDEKKIADRLEPRHLTLTGSHVTGLIGGTPAVVPVSGGKAESVALTGSLRVDRQAHQQQRFNEAARVFSLAFYDGSFKGIDWPGATAKYSKLAGQTWTNDEFDDVANRYLGLLTASHMGIRSPSDSAENSQPNGRLGATYRRIDVGFVVESIEPQTPAALGPMRLQPGDVITAIDFEPFTPADTVAARLKGKIGSETPLTVLRTLEDAEEPVELTLLITPISYRSLDGIRYENWRLANQQKVAELSNGRLGYIHIESMNQSSLAEYERDLYAACAGKDGLIIDVRDNGGGWTTDRLLASIMTRRHAYTVPRGADPNRTNSYPISRLFIARYNLPINAMCNENSFSNAEIFSHAFKTLQRGTLVGNTTAGGVISTGRATLLDGTSIRLPFRGWYLPDDTDMENNGAVPDLLIPQLPVDEVAGRDPQLEAAVRDLLQRLD